jgi:hypothetical protein
MPKHRDSPCWIWPGAKSRGYGVKSVKGKSRVVHRIIYERLYGPVPEGMQLDHLCRNRACCNPFHLEIVTCQENLRRGPTTLAAKQTAITHCPRGHPYDEENTYVYKGMRHCRECNREHNRQWYQRQHPSAKARGPYKRDVT